MAILLSRMNNVAKLREILEHPLNEEPTVLQFLVEVRKVVEEIRSADNTRFIVLKFFCDWVLHPSLDKTAAKSILKGLDNFIDQVKLQGTPTQSEADIVKRLVSFRMLQTDLAVFLTEHRLDTELVGDSEEWGSFFSTYLNLIERTPLVDPKQGLSLTYIDRIQVSKSHITLGPPAGADERFLFRIVWEFQKDGVKTGSISNEVWFPKVPQRTQIPVLNMQSKPDGRVDLVGLETKKFLWDAGSDTGPCP